MDTFNLNTHYHVVSVTPAGRKAYLEILAVALLKNKHVITEHRFWVNTDNPEDINYLHQLSDEHPEFFKLDFPTDRTGTFPERLWRFYRLCSEPNTIYIKLDDDICYIEDNAIEKLISYRLAQADCAILLGNVINNTVCSAIHELIGVKTQYKQSISKPRIQESEFTVSDKLGSKSGKVAECIHTQFLADVRKGNINMYRFNNIPLLNNQYVHINVMSWFGRDIETHQKVFNTELFTLQLRDPFTNEKRSPHTDEDFFNRFFPTLLGRSNHILGDALFTHFAFTNQRNYLENCTNLLEYYDNSKTDIGEKKSIKKKVRFIVNVFTHFLINKSKRVVWFIKSIVRPSSTISIEFDPFNPKVDVYPIPSTLS